MKANNTLKGQALHTYNRVMNAMAEDNDASMLHAFAALTQQAKSIALQSGKFSNAYVRGELKGMTAEEAAKDLTARAAACVSCKVRNIDMIIATAFLTEYISRQRKEIETPNDTTPETKAVEFSDLSHAATNIVLTAENDGEIYRRHVEPLISSLTNKLAKGVTLNAATLVTSGKMAVIIREAIKVMRSAGWDAPVTAADRKEAAKYLAAVYISDAEEEYNHTTKA